MTRYETTLADATQAYHSAMECRNKGDMHGAIEYETKSRKLMQTIRNLTIEQAGEVGGK